MGQSTNDYMTIRNSEKEKFIATLEALIVHPGFQRGVLLIVYLCSTHKIPCIGISLNSVNIDSDSDK